MISVCFIRALTRTHHSPLLIQVISILRVCQCARILILYPPTFNSNLWIKFNSPILTSWVTQFPISNSNSQFQITKFSILTSRSFKFHFSTFGSLNSQFRPSESHNFDLSSQLKFSILTVRSSLFSTFRVIQISNISIIQVIQISTFGSIKFQYPISIIFNLAILTLCRSEFKGAQISNFACYPILLHLAPFLRRVRGSSFFSHAILFVHLAPLKGEFEGTRVFREPFAKQFPISYKEPLYKGETRRRLAFLVTPQSSY